ncbi:MAG: 4-(cytidine 5'-diphospho)-2-C-methyl-D-erythritol kinase [Candidatus Omnitrophica bacterium]|nr:4-(cytidine 5'-diphospho)-2-C-methyl-D-erythritol kinase [Candidatus Omnitrophota bacterium]
MNLPCFAKLNIHLRVLRKRKDNYHSLVSLFERISLCDRISLFPRADNRILFSCNDPDVPGDASNLCHCAAVFLRSKYGISKGATIRLTKRIPVGAGLGGGSSNAAAVLQGLNTLWGLGLSLDELAGCAAKIGSDVPFFVYNTSFALVRGRGEKVYPLKKFAGEKWWHILVVPKIHVSTPFIYREWDKLKADSRLTKVQYGDTLSCFVSKNRHFPFGAETLFNNLEQVTIRLYPEIAKIKQRLQKYGVTSSLMSGSGPAVFGIVTSRRKAVTIAGRLAQEGRSWQVFVVRTA